MEFYCTSIHAYTGTQGCSCAHRKGTWQSSEITTHLTLSTTCRWAVSYLLQPLHPQHALNMMLDGPQTWSVLYREEINLLPLLRIEPKFLKRWVHCIVTIPTTLPGSHLYCSHMQFLPSFCYFLSLFLQIQP